MHNRPGNIFAKVKMYKQGSASIKLCLLDILIKAQARNELEIIARTQQALQHCETVQRLEYDWNKRNKTNPLSRTDAVDTNHQLTTTLTQMNTIITSHADGKRDSPQRRAARRIRQELLPDGVRVITALRYEEKHGAIHEICRRIDINFKDDLTLISLLPCFEDLLELNELFSNQLAVNDKKISRQIVDDARDIAEDAFYIVFTLVLAATVDDMDDRKNFLSSVTDQQARLAHEMKTRHTKKSLNDTPEEDTVQNIISDAERGADLEEEQTPSSSQASTHTQPQSNTEDSSTQPAPDTPAIEALNGLDNSDACSDTDAPQP